MARRASNVSQARDATAESKSCLALADYKEAKEAFVAGITGSSIYHINIISLVSFISLGVYGDAVLSRSRRPQSFLLDWATLVLPVLLSITVFAERPLLLAAMTLVAQWPLTTLVQAFLSRTKATPAAQQDNSLANARTLTTSPGRASLASVSAYRAHMMILTALAILAVDFPVFPRFLAKCESFGTSMMDIGVGAFVFSQGVVSAIPILRDPKHLFAPMHLKVLSVFRKVAPLFALGLVRVLLVKGTDYPEHVTEYGVHWNFFLTIAFLPLLEVLLHPLVARVQIAVIALAILVVHQGLLSFTSLQDFALNAPRNDLFSMNREGIISIPGYFAIHLLGLLTGTITIPPSPGHFRRALKEVQRDLKIRHPSKSEEESDSGDEAEEQDSFLRKQQRKQPITVLGGRRDNGKVMTELFSYSLLWWFATAIMVLVKGNEAVSRRLANFPYVIWTAAYNTTALGVYQNLNSNVKKFVSTTIGKGKTLVMEPDLQEPPPPPNVARSPPLFEAINKNGLVFFLLANVMTGAVNLSMRTMYAGDTLAMTVLVVYSLVITYVAWVFRDVRLIKI
ncbi:GWT1-domain-containing protein [Auriculariales sp. MPI-PUGE-AT-0066]|nr:GWT1-domain-containing protein [Auriculariales sp. MPI-PUGE-AT-0066]